MRKYHPVARELESKGYKVRFMHWRPKREYPEGVFYRYYRRSENNFEPAEKGGRTVCLIEIGDATVGFGQADFSHLDNFCYSLANNIAFGRAYKIFLEEGNKYE